MFNSKSVSKRMEKGWSGPEVACKRHQNHKQLQGVCPFCLRERLSQLAAASLVSSISSSSSSSKSSSPANYYSSSASYYNNTSPDHRRRRRHNRNVSEIMGSISFRLSVGNSNDLKKSRSIAFVPRNFVGDLKNGTKKKGFWSKLLHRERSSKKDIFMHSKTVNVRESY